MINWLICYAMLLLPSVALSQIAGTQHDYSIETEPASRSRPATLLIEEFTAHTLPIGEVQLGTDFDIGVTDNFDLGTDVVSGIFGVPSIKLKAKVYENKKHTVALGLRAAYLSRESLLWGSVKDHFDTLEGRIFRPAISWSHKLSPRLSLHTFWAKGLGPIDVELSEKGRRTLWESKYPEGDYDTRNQGDETVETDETDDGEETEDTIADVSSEENQEGSASENSSIHNQSAQVQSITGLVQDRFQMTGEFRRQSGNKVLITTRIEQSTLEELKSNFIRLTVAHQWVWDTFQMRLGVGAQYFSITGKDLDDEVIDKTDVEPASDISFYWRF